MAMQLSRVVEEEEPDQNAGDGSEDEQARKLLDQYRNDIEATWSYGRALVTFRAEGDTPNSRRLLGEARRRNPHVPAYLLGLKRLPDRRPDLVTLGDESEATNCAAGQSGAWADTPGALEWLAAHRLK